MSSTGKIAQIIGPVIDVAFESGNPLPDLFNALYVDRPGGQRVVLECQQHLGEDSVRTIAMDGTEGLMRGMPVVDTGKPIQMPTGTQIKGRLFNVVGEAIDGLRPMAENTVGLPIHRKAPAFEDLSTSTEVLLPVSRSLT